jgi:eukaryotic-like serine/threonine-protein kinase
MDANRWEEVRATFDAVVKLDAAARGNRLTALGSTDPELRAAVESLLGADADASERLSTFDSLLANRAASTPDLGRLAGRTISHFRVLEPLGAGGMGVVYRGEDTRLGRVVALKFLPPEPSSDAAARARFLREARSVAALDHPNLCTLHDVGETEDGRPFLAMALYPGETLKARLDRNGPLPVRDALDIARQVALGLKCAHAAGIVHRDLKPGNIMLLPDGTVKVLDFGLAKARDESLSTTGALLGTVAYMAPEQIRGEAVDARTDLWALGIVLYEMLVGKKPFAGEHHVSVAHAIVHDDPVQPTALRDGLPLRAEAIVLTLLQKDVRTRYATADEVIADLAGVESGDRAAVRASQARPLPTPRRRAAPRPWRMVLGAALAIGAATAAVFVARPGIVRSLRSDAPGSISRYSIALPEEEALGVSDNGFNRIAISPNGEYFAYVGSTRLMLRRRDELHATPVAGGKDGVNPFFSPDGSHLGFLVIDTAGGRPALKVVPVGGGTPATLIDSAIDIGGAAWGHDGYIYYDGHLEGDGIARVRETGGRPEALTMSDRTKGDWWHCSPEPLPNGRGVLFVVAHPHAADYEIAVLDLETRVTRRLLNGVSPRYAASGHIVYATVGGTLMAVPFDESRLALTGPPVTLLTGLGALQSNMLQDVAISANGTLVYTTNGGAEKDVVWVTRDGTVTPVDSAWRDAFTSVVLSPNGTELAVGVDGPTGRKVWIKRVGGGRASMLRSEGVFDEHPAWTPDGRSVMFLSNGSDPSKPGDDLYVSRADGSSVPRLLLENGGEVNDAEYSRDGRWLVYQTKFNLFAIRAGHDSTRIPLVATRFSEVSPRLSPDGRWLAYTSDEAGRYDVYVRPFPNTGSAKWRVSPAGGIGPIWSPSGRELFYKSSVGQLVAVSVLPGVSFSAETQHALFPIDVSQNDWQSRDYDVSPDGKRFVMIRPPKTPRSDLIVVEGFFEDLRARVGH